MVKKIAYQGREGAYSNLACKSFFPKYHAYGYASFDDVFEQVKEGNVDLGILPIENSYAGRVPEIHNLLSQTNLYIVGEYFQEIKHCLAAPQGVKLNDLEEVCSHAHALMQCSKKIKKHKLKKISYSNTAAAAEYIAKQNDPKIATICSGYAAKINNLKILDKNFSDIKDNYTIFIAIAKKIDYLKLKNSAKITTMLFTVRNIPASIYKALGGFASNQINLLKIESYIAGGASKEAQFFVSFIGSPDEKKVQYALEELGFYTKNTKLLGVYNAARERGL